MKVPRYRYGGGTCAPKESCQNRLFLTQPHMDEFVQYVRWH